MTKTVPSRIALALFASLLAAVGSGAARAQAVGTKAMVVTQCGQQAFAPSINGQQNYAPLTMLSNGTLCDSGSGSSGGGGTAAAVPPASGTGGTTGPMLGTTPNTTFIPAATATRRSLTVTNEANPASGTTITLCPVPGPTPAAYVAGCYTFGPGGSYSAPASGYVPQDGFSAVASAPNTPVTIDNH